MTSISRYINTEVSLKWGYPPATGVTVAGSELQQARATVVESGHPEAILVIIGEALLNKDHGW